MKFLNLTKTLFAEALEAELKPLKIKLDELSRCRDSLLESDDSIAYCEVHERFHCSQYFDWEANSSIRRAVLAQIRYKKNIFNKLGKIIYYHISNNNYTYIIDYLVDSHEYARRHKRICRILVSAFNKAYINRLNAISIRMLLRREREDGLRELKRSCFSARYADILVEDCGYQPEIDIHNDPDNFVESVRLSIKRKSTRPRVELSNLYDVIPPYEDKVIQRSSELLIRLRDIIRDFRIARLSHKLVRTGANAFLHCLNDLSHREPLICVAESDTPQDEKGGGISTTVTHQNVQLTEARQEDVDIPSVSVSNFWSNTSSTDVKGRYTEMTDRYIELDNFEWNKNMGQHTIIASYELPRDLFSIDGGDMCSRPNTLPFQVHRYFKTDMEIKIHINANKFQIGQLICAWYYAPQFDDNFDSRLKFQCLSTTNHVLLTANVSNEATLKIPYQYYAPYLSSRDRDDMPPCAIMGKLIIMVANPLTVPVNGPTSCHGTVFIRFYNCEFTGMIASSIGKNASMCTAEGDVLKEILGSMAGVAINYIADANRDNPPNPNPPNYLVPTASHSWSVGTGMAEPLHPLRLDGRGQTPHPVNGLDEMSISHVVQQYGFMKTLEWTKNQGYGTSLDVLDAAPMSDKQDYLRQEKSDDTHLLPAYYLPPVAVIASLFNYWRGSIKFRFDFVCSQFHTGRLLIAYVPGAREVDNVTIAQAKSCPHIVFTLNEMQSLTYEIPFISNKSFWHRYYTGNYDSEQVSAPSSVFIFVLNPLVPMEAVSEKLYINVWIAGGNDFEVAVPIQPSIGLNFNRTVLYKDTQMIFSNSSSFYAGTWHTFNSSKSLCIRWGTNSDQVAGFDDRFEKRTTQSLAYYYELYNEDAAPKYQDTDGSLKLVKYGVLLYSYSFYFMALVRDLDTAIFVTRAIKFEKKTPESLLAYFINPTSTTSNTWSTGNPGWLAHEVHKEAESPFEIVCLHEGDDKMIFDSGASTSYTNNGRMLFGERFFDLKDVCRRYQIYTSFVIDTLKQVQVGQCSVIVPVLPHGLELNVGTTKTIIEMTNRCRDGIIPIVASGYRWFRGGVRFRLVIPSRFNALVWVQHRPDRGLRQRSMIACTDIVTAEAVANHGYATYLQLTTVNGCVEFEVPFYQPGMFGMLQKNSISQLEDKYFASLGEIAIGFIMNSSAKNDAKNMLCTLYYSLADDMRFYTFQGFPPMVLCDDISDVKFSDVLSGGKVVSLAQAEAPGWMSWLTPKGAVEGIVTEAKEAVGKEVVPILTDLHSTLDNIKNSLSDISFKKVIEEPGFRSALSQLVHCVINPTASTIAWSIVSFFVEVGLIIVSSLETWVAAFMRYINTFRKPKDSSKDQPSTSSSEQNVEEATQVIAESPGSSDGLTERQEAACGFLTLMWTTLCGLLGVRKKMKDGNRQSWSQFLSNDMGNIFRSSNALFGLIRKIMSVWQAMYNKIIGWLYPDLKRLEMICDAHEAMKAWVEEVLYLCDPEVTNTIPYDAALVERAYAAHTYGMMYVTDFVTEYKAKELAILRICFAKISKIKEDLVSLGKDPHVRKMPFTVCVSGKPGIGKSHMMSAVCTELLKSQNMTVDGAMCCVVNPTSKYWDQCERQPVLVMDDLFAVEVGQTLEQQIQWLFSIVSPVPLTPPMAELSDKKIRYNPEIFWYNTNKPFISLDKVEKIALWRRRDVLIDVRHIHWEVNDKQPVKETKDGCIHCDKRIAPQNLPAQLQECLSDFHHLRFAFYSDVTDESTLGPYMTYKEFLAKLKAIFSDNRQKANKHFTDELKRHVEIMDQNDFKPYSYKENVERIKDKVQEAQFLLQKHTIQEYIGTKFNSMKDMIVKCAEGKVDHMLQLFGLNLQMMKDAYTKGVEDYNTTRSAIAEGPEDTSDATVTISFDAMRRIVTNANDPLTLVEAYQESVKKEWDCDRLLEKWDHLKKYLNKDMLFLLDKCIYLDHKYSELHPTELYIVYSELLGDYWGVPYSVMTWERAIDKWRVYGSENGKVKSCKCYLIDPTCMLYEEVNGKTILTYDNNERQQFQTAELFFTGCSYELCPFKTVLYKYVFWNKWLKLTSARSRAYIRKDYSLVPRELFSDKSLVDFPDINTWKNYFIVNIEKMYAKYLKGPAMKLWNMFSKTWPLVAGILGIISVVYGGVSAYKNKDVIKEAVGDMATKFKNKVPTMSWSESMVYQPAVPKAAPRKNVAPAAPQAAQQFEVVLDRLKRNFVEVTVCYQLKYITYTCVALRNRQLLMLRHFVEEIDSFPPDKQVFIKYASMNVDMCKYGVEVNFADIKRIYYNNVFDGNSYKSNIVLVEMPLCIPEAKDIVKFLAKVEDHKFVNSLGALVTPKQVFSGLPIKRCDNNPHVIASTDVISSVYMEDTYIYPMHGKGMCGSILLDPNVQRPIIGVHVAGMSSGGDYGISEILCYEMFEPVIDKERVKRVAPELGSIDLSTIDVETALFPYGTVPGNMAQAQCPKSAIVPSRIHGVFPVEQEPNPLSEFDKRLPPGNPPIQRGIENMGLPPIDFKTDILELCYEDLKLKILSNVVSVRSKIDIVDMQTAVCGNPNIKGFESLELSTSPGFPLSSAPDKKSGKRWLFDFEQDENGHNILVGIHPDLKKLMEVSHALRLKEVRPFTIFADCLKDTTLPKAKCCIPGKTRIFSIAPVQFTILFKQYYLDFLASYQTARFDAEHAIGINCQSLEWTRLASLLLANGRTRIITGDYKNFGPGLMRKAVEKAFEIIIAWYASHGADDESQRIRRIMADEIINAPHLAGNMVYFAPCGIPSGSPITTPLNSLVNSLYIRYVYMEIVNKPFSYLHDNSFICTYGDDVLISVSDELSELFNTQSMSDEFAKYKIVFTDADKTDRIIKYRHILESTFLKRKFAPHPTKSGIWVGLLEKQSIQNTPNWVHRSHYEDDEVLRNMLECCMLNAFEWGKEYYDHIGQTLMLTLRERGIKWFYEPWDSLNRQLY